MRRENGGRDVEVGTEAGVAFSRLKKSLGLAFPCSSLSSYVLGLQLIVR